MEDYLAALASHSSQADVQKILERATAVATGPLSRIRRLAAISFDSTIFRLDRAMRVWPPPIRAPQPASRPRRGWCWPS
jgi:hypothetical protein